MKISPGEKDAVAPLIARRCRYLNILHEESQKLCGHIEDATHARDEIEKERHVREGTLPEDSQQRADYLDLCERVCNTEAITTKESLVKAGAAMSILANINKHEMRGFPDYVRKYMLRQQIKALPHVYGAAKLRKRKPKVQHVELLEGSEHSDIEVDSGRMSTVSEWMSKPSSLEESYFVLNGTRAQDEKAYRVTGYGRSRGNGWWDVQFEGDANEVRMSDAEMEKLLLDSRVAEEDRKMVFAKRDVETCSTAASWLTFAPFASWIE